MSKSTYFANRLRRTSLTLRFTFRTSIWKLIIIISIQTMTISILWSSNFLFATSWGYTFKINIFHKTYITCTIWYCISIYIIKPTCYTVCYITTILTRILTKLTLFICTIIKISILTRTISLFIISVCNS